jgi:hypothetical protein
MPPIPDVLKGKGYENALEPSPTAITLKVKWNFAQAQADEQGLAPWLFPFDHP